MPAAAVQPLGPPDILRAQSSSLSLHVCPPMPAAGVAGGMTYEAYKGFQRGVALVPHVVLGALSAAMTLFLLYNLAAGGNPPPKEKAAA
jgi:hypothetical protein